MCDWGSNVLHFSKMIRYKMIDATCITLAWAFFVQVSGLKFNRPSLSQRKHRCDNDNITTPGVFESLRSNHDFNPIIPVGNKPIMIHW